MSSVYDSKNLNYSSDLRGSPCTRTEYGWCYRHPDNAKVDMDGTMGKIHPGIPTCIRDTNFLLEYLIRISTTISAKSFLTLFFLKHSNTPHLTVTLSLLDSSMAHCHSTMVFNCIAGSGLRHRGKKGGKSKDWTLVTRH